MKAEKLRGWKQEIHWTYVTDSETYWSKVRKTQTAEYRGSITPIRERGQADRHIVLVLCESRQAAPYCAGTGLRRELSNFQLSY